MDPIGYVWFGDHSSMTTKATKADAGKPRLDLIPPEATMALGEVLGFGAEKYAARNWEKGMEWGRFIGAAKRHLTAWEAGENDDPESGFPHLWHVLTNIAFLVAYEVRGSGTDDRTTYCRMEDDDQGPLEVKGTIDPAVEDDEDDMVPDQPPTMKRPPRAMRDVKEFQAGLLAITSWDVIS